MLMVKAPERFGRAYRCGLTTEGYGKASIWSSATRAWCAVSSSTVI
jgi:hypothetical protein